MMKILLVFIFIFQSCIKSKVEEKTETIANTECSQSSLGLTDKQSTPGTVDELTELVNLLPRPATVPCLIQSLKRPLNIYITNSTQSAQPAASNESPRVFIFTGNLILSIVPVGATSEFLEVSQLISDTRSIKAELKFPFNSSISKSLAYDTVNPNGNGVTTCKGCHGTDFLDSSITHSDAYNSEAIKPFPSMKISPATLEVQSIICDSTNTQSYRCKLIQSIFKQGNVINKEFPTAMDTFF
jgi:hypothetical protein